MPPLMHLSKPQKQRIWSTEWTKMDIKFLIAKSVAAVMDMRDIAKMAKSAEQAKELGKVEGDFQAGQW